MNLDGGQIISETPNIQQSPRKGDEEEGYNQGNGKSIDSRRRMGETAQAAHRAYLRPQLGQFFVNTKCLREIGFVVYLC